MVRIEYLMPADSAMVTDGNLDLTGGGWDSLIVADLSRPVRLPFACGVLVPWAETEKEHTLVLSIQTAGGKPVAPPYRQTFRTGRAPSLVPGAAARVSFAIQWDITFPAYGRYVLVATVDGASQTERRREFSIGPAAQAEPAISEEEMNIIDEELSADQ